MYLLNSFSLPSWEWLQVSTWHRSVETSIPASPDIFSGSPWSWPLSAATYRLAARACEVNLAPRRPLSPSVLILHVETRIRESLGMTCIVNYMYMYIYTCMILCILNRCKYSPWFIASLVWIRTLTWRDAWYYCGPKRKPQLICKIDWYLHNRCVPIVVSKMQLLWDSDAQWLLKETRKHTQILQKGSTLFKIGLLTSLYCWWL